MALESHKNNTSTYRLEYGQGSERAVVEGAVRFGALFAVHGAPVRAGGAKCGAVREHYGIQRVEATLRALDAINADTTLLPNVILGADLRDSCWAPSTALRQTIDLVRDAIAPPRDFSHIRRHRSHGDECKVKAASYEWGDEGRRAPLLGVLGPGASSAAVQVQNLLQLFSIPQVSYSATSRELSDRARFSTFFRVVPSDLHQARLLVALLQAHNWTYVHALHTDESYGQSGMAVFREEAARGGVCVAREVALRAAPSDEDVDAALQRLLTAEPRSQVAVCWCEGRTARAVLAGLTRLANNAYPDLQRFLSSSGPALRLVGSDGWADRGDVVSGLETAAREALTLRIRSPYITDFDAYYHALRPQSNRRNPWFQEFWEQKFNCSLSDDPLEGVQRCTGNESLAKGYTQEPKLALVVRGVYAFAHALHDMVTYRCSSKEHQKLGLCPAMFPFNVSLYRRHLERVRFQAPDGGLVAFDENGDPPPELSEYDVMSFVEQSSGEWRYVRIGRWRRGRLRLRKGKFAPTRRTEGIVGSCAAKCRAGEWARAGVGRARCCTTCVQCRPLAVTKPTGCRLCLPGYRPDVTRTICLPSPVEWGGAVWARAACATVGAAGLAAALLCTGVFWKHRNTPVVKSASRELCALLLCCAAACHCAAIAAAAKPGPLPCMAVRLAAPALGGVYAAVAARTVRIARLVAAASGARKPRLVSSRAQIGMWTALSAAGMVAATWAAVTWPPTPKLQHPGRSRSVLACGGERAVAQLVPLAPALALLLACCVLAVRTRRLPHNFSETRFIGAAAYTTCVIWVAFFPVYARTSARTLTMCACVSLSAGAVVLVSLGVRVWVCVCRPHRNTRAHFLTATSIRCHLGKYRPVGSTVSTTLQTDRRDTGSQTVDLIWCSSKPDEPCVAAGVCARVVRLSPMQPPSIATNTKCPTPSSGPIDTGTKTLASSPLENSSGPSIMSTTSSLSPDSALVVIALFHHHHSQPYNI